MDTEQNCMLGYGGGVGRSLHLEPDIGERDGDPEEVSWGGFSCTWVLMRFPKGCLAVMASGGFNGKVGGNFCPPQGRIQKLEAYQILLPACPRPREVICEPACIYKCTLQSLTHPISDFLNKTGFHLLGFSRKASYSWV